MVAPEVAVVMVALPVAVVATVAVKEAVHQVIFNLRRINNLVRE